MFLTLVFCYLAIGFFIGVSNVSKGRVGASGPFLTIVAAVFLWPLVLMMG